MIRIVYITLAFLFSSAVFAQSNAELEKHFLADQEARSPSNMENKIFPMFKDEIGRRIFVFNAIANGELETTDDFFHAAVILQHTNVEFVGEQLKSMGNENHLLAYFLAKRAYELGHSKGAWLMAATYNRYLENAGFDVNKYGLSHENNVLLVNDNSVTNEERAEKGLVLLSN